MRISDWSSDVCSSDLKLPTWELPITPTLVVSTAIATRDFQDVHHDRDIAQAAGSKDIFVNILTSNALCERYVTDWAGPQVQIKGIAIRSEERRGGNEGVSQCRSGWSQYHKKHNKKANTMRMKQ